VRGIPVTAVVVASVSLLAAGCGHTLAWPLTPADVNRINEEAARENGWLRVEYVEPIPRAQRVEPIAIAAADVRNIEFRTKDGDTRFVQADAIEGVTVKDRALGALLWGGGFAAVMGALLLYYLDMGGAFDEDRRACWSCENAAVAGYLAGSVALAGAVFGYALGVRRTYTFTGRP
jgi:hypothetical protein